MKKYFLKIVERLSRLFDIEIVFATHNGSNICDYPDRKWTMVPFPSQKGMPYNHDNLATVNRHRFITEPDFLRAKEIADKRWNTESLSLRDISWRLNTALWAASYALGLDKLGCMFVECGTGRGYMAAAILEYCDLSTLNKDFYLVDTFKSDLAVSENNYTESPADFAYADDVKEVTEYFSKYPTVHILQGFIPDVLSDLPGKPIAFLHVDLNSAPAEREALEHLRSYLFTGSIILFDDYGGYGGDEQALVHEAFAVQHGKKLLVLPTGQAIIIW